MTEQTLTAAVAEHLAEVERWKEEGGIEAYHRENEHARLAMEAASTEADWVRCVEVIGEREVGVQLSCENDDWASDGQGDGFGILALDGFRAVTVRWYNSGRHDVEFCTQAEAEAELARMNDEWAEPEEDEEDEPETQDDTPCLDDGGFHRNEMDVD